MLFAIVMTSILVLYWINTSTVTYSGKNRKNTGDPGFFEDYYLRSTMSRKQYYREVYLKSEAWQRKRHVVLRRDNWTCVYCGAKATQVHHTQYAKINIGKEPIHWLVSVCKICHQRLH